MTRRAVAGALSAITLVHVAALVPRFVSLSRGAGLPEIALLLPVDAALVATLLGAGLSLLLIARSWHRENVRSLALFLAMAAASWGLVLRTMEFFVLDGTLSASAEAPPWAEGLLVAILPCVGAAFLGATATFPETLNPGEVGSTDRAWVAAIRRTALAPSRVWSLALALGAAVMIAIHVPAGPDASLFHRILWISAIVHGPGLFILISMAAGVQNLFDGARRSRPENRRHLLWLLGGVAGSALMIVVPISLVPLVDVVGRAWLTNLVLASWGLAPLVLVLAIGLAVFYTGAIDPELVLARGTLLGIGATLWVATYAGLEAVLSDWIQDSFGLPSALVSVVLALVVASAAAPIRRRLAPMAAAFLDPETE